MHGLVLVVPNNYWCQIESGRSVSMPCSDMVTNLTIQLCNKLAVTAGRLLHMHLKESRYLEQDKFAVFSALRLGTVVS